MTLIDCWITRSKVKVTVALNVTVASIILEKHLSQSLYISHVGRLWLVDDPYWIFGQRSRSQWPSMSKYPWKLLFIKFSFFTTGLVMTCSWPLLTGWLSISKVKLTVTLNIKIFLLIFMWVKGQERGHMWRLTFLVFI